MIRQFLEMAVLGYAICEVLFGEKRPMKDVTPKDKPGVVGLRMLPGERRGDSRTHYTGKSEYFH